MKNLHFTLQNWLLPEGIASRRLIGQFVLLGMLLFLSQTAIAQACGEPDWNDPTLKATITGDFAIPGTGATSGPIAVLVDSDQGTSVGSKNNTATNRAVFTFQFPEATVLTGIEINVSAADVIRTATTMRVEASNDGMNYTPVSIDYVLGTNLSSGAPQYGGTAAVAYTLPFATNQTEYTYYRVFAPTMRTNFGRSFNEIYFDYEFFDPQVTNLTCNDNSTTFQFDDDGVVFTLNPGPGSGTYDISLVGSSYTISPTTATYGVETTFTVSNGSAGAGDLTVRLNDQSVPCVQDFIVPNEINACLPGACGEPDWNDPAMKATIMGDFAIPGTGATSGAIAVLVDSDQGSGVGSKNNTATNRAVFTFQFPEATVLTGVEINVSAADVIRTTTVMRVEASNDGVTYTPVSIDYTLGTNLSSGAPQYGGTAAVAYTLPFANNQTEYTYYRVFAPTMRTNFGRSFNEIYFDYEFFDPQVTNLDCNDNGSFENYLDDQVTFDLNPSPGTGTYTVAIDGGYTISPTSGTYGQVTSFTVSSGSSGSGDLTLTLIDTSVPCTQTVIIPNTTNACIPGACGTLDWNMVANKQNLILSATASTNGNINVLKDGNDNNNSFYYPSNSIAGLEVIRVQFPEPAVIRGLEYTIGNSYMFNTNATTMVQASNDGSTWVDMVPNAAGTSPSLVISGSTYVKNRGLGNNHPGVINTSAGSAETFFWDNTTAYLYYRIQGVSGNMNLNPWINELYFAYDLFDAQVANVSFGNNGTPGVFDDDKLLFELNPAPGTGTYTVQVLGGYSVTPATGTYGAATSFEVSSGSAGTGDLTALIIDQSVPCVQEVIIPNPNLDVSIVASQAVCASPADSPLGSITLTGTDGTIIKAEYNPGTQYAGTGFAAATDVTGLSSGFALVNNLPNPEYQTFYYVRAYASETLFRDDVVSLSPKVCSVADLELSITPASATVNEGENVVYTVTLTNNGPDPAINVEVKVDLLNGLDLINASPTLGGYSPGTELWTIDQVPLGSQTLTITYRMR